VPDAVARGPPPASKAVQRRAVARLRARDAVAPDLWVVTGTHTFRRAVLAPDRVGG